MCSRISRKTAIAKYAEGPQSQGLFADCRERTSDQQPRAEKSGDLLPADKKVLNEEHECATVAGMR